MNAVSPVAVVHLVREENGVESLSNFVESYRSYPGYYSHDLIFAYKSSHNELTDSKVLALLRSTNALVLTLPDKGYDIGSYWLAAGKLDYKWFCFINSYSQIQASGWLRSLMENAQRDGIGIAGATASYESPYSASINWKGQLSDGVNQLLRRVVRNMRNHARNGRHFHPFPNPHVRTNAFCIAKVVMDKIAVPDFQEKADAIKFESGKNSLTRQVIGLGLRALVVRNDCTGVEMSAWHTAATFRQGGQAKLLVSDNRTRDYANAGPARKAELAKLAWGNFTSDL